jgi:hypothetical protein
MQPPIWKKNVTTSGFEERNKLAIQGELQALNDQRRSGMSADFMDNGGFGAPKAKSGIGTVRFDLGGGIFDERDAEELEDDPIYGNLASEALFKRDVKNAKDEATMLDIELDNPDRKRLTSKEREEVLAIGAGLQETDPQHIELKKRLIDDDDLAEKERRRWELKKRVAELGSMGVNGFRQQRFNDRLNQTASEEQKIREKEAAIAAKESAGVAGRELETHTAEKARVQEERKTIEQRKQQIGSALQEPEKVWDEAAKITDQNAAIQKQNEQMARDAARGINQPIDKEAEARSIVGQTIGTGIVGKTMAGKESEMGLYEKVKDIANTVDLGEFLTFFNNPTGLVEAKRQEMLIMADRVKSDLADRGYTGTEADRIIKDAATEYAWTNNDKDLVRQLSSNQIVINPTKIFGENKDKIVQNIEQTNSDQSVKNDALARLQYMRESMAQMLEEKLYMDDIDFKAFADQWQDGDKVAMIDTWQQKMKNRPGYVKATDAILGSFYEGLLGIRATVEGAAAGAAALVGADTMAGNLGERADLLTGFVRDRQEASKNRGLTGGYAVTGELTNTITQMAPMLYGGALASGMRPLAAAATRGMSVYGWAAAQGYSSKLQDAVDMRKTAANRQLNPSEIAGVLSDPQTQIAAFANGIQTAAFAKWLGGGAERIVMDSARRMTVLDLLKKSGRKQLFDAGMKQEFKQMARTMFGDGLDEAVEEGLNQLTDKAISSAALGLDVKLGDLAEETMHAALLGGVIGAGLPQARFSQKQKADATLVTQGQTPITPEEERTITGIAKPEAFNNPAMAAQYVTTMREIDAAVAADPDPANGAVIRARATGALKIAGGKSIAELTTEEINALGIKRDGTPMGNGIQPLVDIVNDTPVLIDAAVQELERMAPSSKGLISMSEGEARSKFSRSKFMVTSKSGQQVEVDAMDEAEAQNIAAGMFQLGDTVETVTPVAKKTAAPSGGSSTPSGAPITPSGGSAPADAQTQQQLEAVAYQQANDWDITNRNYRTDLWFEGGNANMEAIQGYNEALSAGGAKLQAHGMAKEATLSGGIRNLLGLLRNGLDPARRGGRLDTAQLVTDNAMASGGATASGTAYKDGPFTLIARPGQILSGNLSGLGAVIINQANADQAASIKAAIQAVRPDVIVGTTSELGSITKTLLGQQSSQQGAGQTGSAPKATAVQKAIAKRRKKSKFANERIVETNDPNVLMKAVDDTIVINPAAVEARAKELGLNDAGAAKWVDGMIDEEVRHLVQMRAAREIYGKSGSTIPFQQWLEERYTNIWQKEFVATGKADIVRQLYGPNLDKMPEWKQAMEGERMLWQQKYRGQVTEVARLWLNVGKEVLENIKALLKQLKALVNSGDLSGDFVEEIANLEAKLKEIEAQASQQQETAQYAIGDTVTGKITSKDPKENGTIVTGVVAQVGNGFLLVRPQTGNPVRMAFNDVQSKAPKAGEAPQTPETPETPESNFVPLADGTMPNKFGVYSKENAEELKYETKKAKAAIYVAQLANGKWISANEVNHSSGNASGFSMPLSQTETFNTREEAILARLPQIIKMQLDITRAAVNEGTLVNAAQKLQAEAIFNWATNLAKQLQGAAPETPETPETPADKFNQQEYAKRKRALNKAINAQNWQEVIQKVDEDLAYFEQTGYPDDWSKWENAKEDAQAAMRRADAESVGKPLKSAEGIQLTPGEQALRDAMEGLFASDLGTSQTYRESIPADRIQSLMSAAIKLIEDGRITPESLAESLDRISDMAGKPQILRKYSYAIWQAFKAVDTTLTDPNWNAVYGEAMSEQPSILAEYPTVEFPIDRLQLSQDVPQFKGDADAEGVVEKLEGKYERLGTGAILVWERANGDFEVISGRHRFNLAKSTGETTIPAQIVRESDGFTRAMALTADAELNIRDGQGTIKDYANYFRASKITEREAKQKGLLGRAKGRAGWAIGANGSQELFDLHANKRISDSTAEAIASTAPGDAALQAVGIKAAVAGGKADMVRNLMMAARQSASEKASAGEQGDLFGFDDSAMQAMENQAKVATKMQKDIREQIAAVSGAAKRPEQAAKMGVDVKNPEAVSKKIAELRAELERWENWPMHSDLVAITRGEIKPESSGQGEQGTPDKKQLEEQRELEMVLASRKIVQGEGTQEQKYNELVDMYESMPAFGAKTSTSKINQAYSTPAPLAYAAGMMIGEATGSVYDSAAGHAMLMVDVSSNNDAVIVNELDPRRLERLRQVSPNWTVTNVDATTQVLDKPVNQVRINPPFGSITLDDGSKKVFSTPMGDTTQIDHAIVLQTLSNMETDGRAVLIIGGPPPIAQSESSRKDFYSKGKSAKFFAYLHENYNVIDHVTINGDLYKQQGAGYPVDVILIDGKDKSRTALPSVKVPTMLNTWAEVYQHSQLNDDARIQNRTLTEEEVRSGLLEAAAELENIRGQRNPKRDDGPPSIPDGRPSEDAKSDSGDGVGTNEIPSGQNQLQGNDTNAEPSGNNQPGKSGVNAGSTRGSNQADTRNDGKTAAVTPIQLTAAEQALENASDGLFASDLSGFSENIPAEKMPAMINAASAMIASGIDTPSGMANSVVRIEIKNNKIGALRRYSESIWSMFRAVKNTLAKDVEWGGIYAKADIDNGVNKQEKTPSKAPQKATQFQVPYTPFSSPVTLGTLMPSNMESAVKTAFDKIKADVGDLRTFVMNRLGYSPEENIEKHFAGEQIDALAEAIWNFEKGGALIVGDQTGIGKGRIAAGLMRYAIKQGFVPVFVTETRGLLDTMYREDMVDIEAQNIIKPAICMTVLDGWEAGKKNKLPHGQKYFDEVAKTGNLEGANAIFTLYSQIRSDTSKSASKQAKALAKSQGKAPEGDWRTKALKRIAPNAVFILDESHNAAGLSTTGFRFAEIMAGSSRVYYSSATSTKRPENMGILFKTNVAKVVGGSMPKLIELMKNGGVPAMQLTSYMLAMDGQYLRRERSFEGIDFNTHINQNTKDRDTALADNLTYALRSIVTVQSRMRDVADIINSRVNGIAKNKKIAASMRDKLETANFSSKVHNVVSQYLLAIKCKSAVDQSMKLIRAGKKVVVGLSNTMESAIDDLSAYRGDPNTEFTMTYKGLVMRYLDKMRMIKIDDKEVRISEVPDPRYANVKTDDLFMMAVSTEGQGEDAAVTINGDIAAEITRRYMWEAYEEARDEVRKVDLGDMPLSPIDYLRQKMEENGVRTGEITGRTLGIDSNGEVYERTKEESNAIKNREAFNDEDLDFLVINQSGATGINLHAGEKMKNKAARAMVVIQPPLDINTFMQMLGRIHRSGQVTLPEFILLQTALPAEFRPAAMLAVKLAMLNANTTSNAKSDISEGNKALDIFNKYGDQIVYSALERDPDLQRQLAPFESIFDKIFDGDSMLSFQDAQNALAGQPDGYIARSITGYLAILPTEEQQLFWDKVTQDFVALIDYLNEMGQNDLESKALPLQAKTIKKEVFTGGTSGQSVFEEPSYVETVETAIGRQPITGQKAVEIGKEAQKQGRELSTTYYNEATRKIDERIAESKAKSVKWNDEKEAKMRGDMIENRNRISDAIRQLGAMGTIKREDGSTGLAIVESVKMDMEKPFAPGSQIFTLQVNDGRKTIKISAAKLKDAFTQQFPSQSEWDKTTFVGSTRNIVTGNLLAAVSKLNGSGQIISYTTDAGETKMGVLLPASYTNRITAEQTRTRNLSTIEDFAKAFEEKAKVSTSDKAVKLVPIANGVEIRVPASGSAGGKYWKKPSLNALMNTGEFLQMGNEMRGSFPMSRLQDVIDNIGEPFIAIAKLAGEVDDNALEASDLAAATPPFYSQLSRAIDQKMPNAANAGQVMQIAMQNAKADEVKWSGLQQALVDMQDDKGKVTKEAVLKYLAEEGAVRFEEVTLGQKQIQKRESILGEINRTGYQVYEDYGDWSISDYEGNDVEFDEVPEDVQSLLTALQAFEPKEGETSADYKPDTTYVLPRYAKYTLPGGENYREVVLTMPASKETMVVPHPKPEIANRLSGFAVRFPDGDYAGGNERPTFWMTESSAREGIEKYPNEYKNNYTSSHFPDIPNYVAHMRLNERDNGLFVEEFQSDRHQAGRKKGYFSSIAKEYLSKKGYVVRYDTDIKQYLVEKGRDMMAMGATEAEAIAKAQRADSYLETGIPDAPFRTTWPLALFKRALRDAVASGKDWIGWTTGDTQNDRNDLRKQVDEVQAFKNDDGTFDIEAWKDGREIVSKESLRENQIADLVGKDLAEKIVNESGENLPLKGGKYYMGDDLKVGGSGMLGFYDNMLPNEIGNYVKQWGGKVEKSEISYSQDYKDWREQRKLPATQETLDQYDKEKVGKSPIWSVKITPKMKKGVEAGQALFASDLSSGDDLFSYAEKRQQEQPTKKEIEAFAFTPEAGNTMQNVKAGRMNALLAYRALTTKRNKGTKLTADEEQQLLDAELALGQQMAFDMDAVRSAIPEQPEELTGKSARMGQRGQGKQQEMLLGDEYTGGQMTLFASDLAQYSTRSTIPDGTRAYRFPGGLITEPTNVTLMASNLEAWHGTPNKVDKFKLDKIGAGEGAQAFGHGLYFAQSKSVGREYQTSLAGLQLGDGSIINPNWDDPRFLAVKELRAANGDVKKARERVVAQSSNWQEQVAAFDEIVKKGEVRFVGNLYRVRLKVDDNQLLNWDKPLNEQSPQIRQILKQAGIVRYLKELESDFAAPSTARGKMKRGHNIYSALEYKYGSAEKASKALLNAGIKGITYLDGNSRATTGGKIIGVWQGEQSVMRDTGKGNWFARVKVANRSIGFTDSSANAFTSSLPFKTKAEAQAWAKNAITQSTSNYVIFDDNDIEILEENGEPVSKREKNALFASDLGVTERPNIASLRFKQLPQFLYSSFVSRPKIYANEQSLKEALREVPKRSFFYPLAQELSNLDLKALTEQPLVKTKPLAVRLGLEKPERGRAYYSQKYRYVSTNDVKSMEASTLVHEVLHSITALEITKYLPPRNKATGIDALKIYDDVRKDTNTPKPLRDLINLFFYASVNLNVKQKNKLIEKRMLFDELTYVLNDPDAAVAIKIPYGFGDIHEFVAEAFSNASFMKILLNLPHPELERKSAWDKFVDIILDYLDFVRKGSSKNSNVLMETVRAALDLATINDSNFENQDNALEASDLRSIDAEYLSAVEEAKKTSDYTKVQRIVTKAALAAGKYPGKWFHGQNAKNRFKSFDPTKGNSFGGWNAFGSWFTLDKKAATSWSNYYEVDEKGEFSPAQGQIYDTFLFLKNPLSLDGYDALLSLWKDITEVATNKATQDNTNKFKQELRSRGYDGIVISNVVNDSPKGADESQTYAIAFDPAQIKLADPITYDADGNVIPLSQRFDPTSDSILYASDLSELDTDYLAAVNRGDMETAQRMVDEAAKKAFPNSIVVDESGNLIPMYHGTSTTFDAFEMRAGSMGKGAYFSSVFEESADYASEKLGVKLSGDNDYGGDFVNQGFIKTAYLNIENAGQISASKYGSGNLIVVATSPTQIKSADPVTYDKSGNVIPLSRRFDPSSDSILYASDLSSADNDYLAAVKSGDMKAAQRMVDQAAKAAGYGVKAYHGSGDKNITVFDSQKAGSVQVSDWGKGIYFTPSQSTADYYRDTATRYDEPKVKAASNKMEATAKKYGTTPMMKWIDFQSKKITEEQYDELVDLDNKWRETLRNTEKMNLGRVYDAYLKIENPYNYVYEGMTDPTLAEQAEESGKDAVIIKNEGGFVEEILVFSASQIKSADPVTYDANGNVIPLSQRFNPVSNSILYASDLEGMNPDRIKEIKAQQDEFGNAVRPGTNRASVGDEATRKVVDVFDIDYEERRATQTREQWVKGGQEKAATNRKALIENAKLLAEGAPDAVPLTPADIVGTQIVIEQMVQEAGDNFEKLLEAGAVIQSYRKMRSDVARVLASGWDRMMKPAERHRRFLANAILTLPNKVASEIDRSYTPAEARKAIRQEVADRLRKIEGALNDMGVTLDEVLGKQFRISPDKRNIIKDIVKDMSKVEQQAMKMHAEHMSADKIMKETGLSRPHLEQLVKRSYDEALARMIEKVRAGMTAANAGISASGLESSPLGMTEEEIIAEAKKLVELGLGLSPKLHTAATKPLIKRTRKPENERQAVAATAEQVAARWAMKLQREKDGAAKTVKKAQHADLVRLIRDHTKREIADFKKRVMALGVSPQQATLLDAECREARTRAKILRYENVNKREHIKWARPEFTNGLIGYSFADADLAEVKRITAALTDAVKAVGKVESLTGAQRTKADAMLAQLDSILAKYGTSAVEVANTGKPLESYRFDINDRAHVHIIANAIRAIDADAIDKGTEWYYFSLLSGLQTMAVNASSVLHSVVDATIGRGFEMLTNIFLQNPMNATLGETKYILRAMGPMLSRARTNFAASFGSETPFFEQDILGVPPDLDRMLENNGMYHKTAISGQKGRFIRIPTRVLLATDEYVKTINACSEVGAMAYRIARAAGLAPGTLEFEDRIKQLVNVPGSMAWRLAAERSYRRTFTNALPGQKDQITGQKREIRTGGEAIGMVVGKGQGILNTQTDKIAAKLALTTLRLMFFPFIKVPYNITALALSYTPLSLIEIATLYAQSRGIKSKERKVMAQAEVIERMSRTLQGGMLTALLLGLAEGDDDDLEKPLLITGSRPYKDTKKAVREVGQRIGLDAYAISWPLPNNKRGVLHYGRVEPIATILATTVDTMREFKAVVKGRKTTSEAIESTFVSFANQLSDKTFLKGLGDLNRAVQGEINMNQFAADKIAMAVPNLIRQPVRELDPNFRASSDEFGKSLLYALFPYGQKEPKIDIYGQLVEKPSYSITRTVDFTDSGSVIARNIDQMFWRYMQRNPGKSALTAPTEAGDEYTPIPGKGSVKMTDNQARMYRELAGKQFEARVKSLTLNYENPTEQDMKKVRSAAEDARDIAKKTLRYNPNWK